MDDMLIVNSNWSFMHGAFFETLKSISSHSHETMHGNIIDSILFDVLPIDSYGLLIDPLIWFFRWIPLKC